MSNSEKQFANISEFGLSVYKIIKEIKNEVNKEFGLTNGDLYYILLVENQPGINQEMIGQTLWVNKSKVARTVDILVKKGFVDRIQDKDNRRQNKIFVTEKGTAVAEKALQIYTEKISNGSDKVEDDLQNEFNSFVEASLQLVN